MPFPDFILSATALVCERVLLETDQVASAIRIVDVFTVAIAPDLPPDAAPLIQTYVLAVMKSVPGHTGEHAMRLRLINTVGESSTLIEDQAKFEAKPGQEELPHSISIVAQLNLSVKRFGTCYVCIDIDGEEIARTPFTVVQKQAETKAS
jgi:hypothetical protein